MEAVDIRSKEQWDKRPGGRLVPMFSMVPSQSVIRTIVEEDPYPITAGFLVGVNPLVTYSNAREVYEAFQKLDFIVASEMFMTPSAEMCDIVLPAASYLEFDSIAPISIQVQQKVAQIGECWPDYRIFNELAKRLGIGEHFWDDDNGCLEDIIEPMGMNFEEFRKKVVFPDTKRYRAYLKDGFGTPSGKVEIYSERCEKMGYDPLPVFKELDESPLSDPELAKEYPLVFTSGKIAPFRHSSDVNIPMLRNAHPDPVVEINPETAKDLGIEDGDWVNIETKRGKIKQKALFSDGIDPRVVYVDYAFWYPEKGRETLYGWDEANINILTDSQPPYSPEVGSNNLRGILCKVYK
jgi:anaerobic selenocysteine-containing dehydrogenase